MLNVEVAYAGIEKQIILSIQVPKGTTVLDAIILSGILKHFAELDMNSLSLKDRVGVYGSLVDLNTIVSEDDRIEIYRPLIRDPKAARREKAKPFLKQKKIQERLDKRARYVKKKPSPNEPLYHS